MLEVKLRRHFLLWNSLHPVPSGFNMPPMICFFRVFFFLDELGFSGQRCKHLNLSGACEKNGELKDFWIL